jgi:GH24 family phage-related lysozyme (muramidase)
VEDFGLDAYGSGLGSVTDCCGHVNEPLGPIKTENLLPS